MSFTNYEGLGNITSNLFNRNFGHAAFSADPYLNGYFYIWFEKLPAHLPIYIHELYPSMNLDMPDIQKLLAGSCIGVSGLPSGTINKVEFTAMGGNKWAVPGSVDYTNSITLKFIEFTDLPIYKILSSWSRMMRERNMGTAWIDMGDYKKVSYSSELYYWTTVPNGNDIQFSMAMNGIFPTKDPAEIFNGDVATVDKVEFDMEFNVDYHYVGDWVSKKVSESYQNVITEEIKNHSTGILEGSGVNSGDNEGA